MSEFATYTSIDQDISSRYKERSSNYNLSELVNGNINEYTNANKTKSIYTKNSQPIFMTEYDDKYKKEKKNKKFENNILEYLYTHTDLVNSILLTLLGLIVRLHNLSQPTQVVFDEVHFGGFANKYLRHTFFMDVHPPLAKLMFALVGYLSGYNGDFSFEKIGMEYTNSVPYTAMRLYSGLCGILVIPIAYYTIRGLSFSKYAAFLGAFLVIFENSLVTQSRLILLDSQLILFAAFTMLAWVNFISFKTSEWTYEWWYWLAMTGLGLGLTVSVKWIGLFIIATIGLATIVDLWEILGNTDNSMMVVIKHFFARALCLIAIPLLVYAFFFEIHFSVLSKKGTGYSFMSPEFQTSFKDINKNPTYYDVAYNSVVHIKHVNTNGGFLHSHPEHYPTGSGEQQVTLYSYSDNNSEWRILPQDNNMRGLYGQNIRNGATVKLQHVLTFKNLHTHDFRPPMVDEDYQNEVCAFDSANRNDLYDNWVVEIVSGKNDASRNYIKTLETEFRLRHKNTGCYLYSHSVKLPEWGFGQQEVTCGNEVLKENTIWRIVKNENPNFNQDNKKIIPKKLSFLEKLIELNKVMFKVNAGLTGSHPYESKPIDWLLFKRGVAYWGSSSLKGSIYLLFNPLIWLFTNISLVVYVIYYASYLIIKHRKSGLPKRIRRILHQLSYPGGLLFTAWAFHFLPFFLMGRQLFMHHYLPAIYFALLLFVIFIDSLLISRVRQPITKIIIVSIISLAVMITFIKFSPLAYGSLMSKSRCESLKLKSTWDINCGKFK